MSHIFKTTACPQKTCKTHSTHPHPCSYLQRGTQMKSQEASAWGLGSLEFWLAGAHSSYLNPEQVLEMALVGLLVESCYRERRLNLLCQWCLANNYDEKRAAQQEWRHGFQQSILVKQLWIGRRGRMLICNLEMNWMTEEREHNIWMKLMICDQFYHPSFRFLYNKCHDKSEMQVY